MTRRSPFQLRRLLDLRRRQEETSRVQLAQSLRKVSSISDEVRHRSEALEAVLQGSADPTRRQHAQMIADMANHAIVAARAAEASAQGTAEELRREWQRAARRLKGLERLEEKKRLDQAEADARAERVRVDEAVTSRFQDEGDLS